MATAASSIPLLKPLSPQEWEALIDDYNQGIVSRLQQWTAANYFGPALVDLSLSSLLRKDFSLNLKIHLLVFLEEYGSTLFTSPTTLSHLLDTLRIVIQSPNPSDAVSLSFSFKEQFLISTTSIYIATESRNLSFETLEALVELLLTITNRPNHGLDRQTRAIACECLRQLELAFPCILSEIGAPLWGLCQSERTHAAQSYVLLLAAVVCNIVQLRPNNASLSLTNASTPLIPFNIPKYLSINEEEKNHVIAISDSDNTISTSWKDADILSYKELRRIISFLLEWPQYLTSFGVLEFMEMTMPVAKALELQPSLLKVQFSGLLYTYDPLLCHAFLQILYLRFMDSFEGQEMEIAQRLVFLSKESFQSHLVFRLLVLHWLSSMIGMVVNRDPGKKRAFVEMSFSFYPAVFDPLALKLLKLDLFAFCSILANDLGSTDKNANGSRVSGVKLFEDGLVCVSSFKWLPPWSTETSVAFRTFHKFLISGTSCADPSGSNFSNDWKLLDSSIFRTVQV